MEEVRQDLKGDNMIYAGKSRIDPRRSLPRVGRWWIEIWLLGRYVGLGW